METGTSGGRRASLLALPVALFVVAGVVVAGALVLTAPQVALAGGRRVRPADAIAASPLATVSTPAGVAVPTAPAVLTGKTAGNGEFAATVVDIAPDTSGGGYWEVAADGAVYNFGNATFYGSMGGQLLNAPVVGMAADPATGGYWLVASDGGIFAFNAPFEGSMGGQPLNAPIVGIAALPDGGGYWEIASDGGIFAFGAPFRGSMGGHPLNAPIVGMAVDPTTDGYWEVASDGGIFAFDAPFRGSMGGQPLNAPVVGMAANPGGGYWEVASDGGIFAFDAPFLGSMGGQRLNAPVVGLAANPGGNGYWEVGADGGVFTFGSAKFAGSATVSTPNFYVPPSNPPANIPANPQYTAVTAGATGAQATADPPCWQIATSAWVPAPSSPQCIAAEIDATDNARATEGLPPIQMPSDFDALTPQEQLFVVADIERVSRGEQPIVGLSSLLDSYAQQGTASNTDPQFSFAAVPSSDWWGSNVASGMLNALDANYTWMYDDGYGGDNIDCTNPDAAGCWGHRDNILTSNYGGTLVMGAGYVGESNGFASLGELFVVVSDPADIPPLYYTWSDAVAAGAGA